MIRVSTFGEITRFDLSRSFFGRGVYWTTAYLVDGLAIDTGSAHATQDLLHSIDVHDVKKIVNTHSHEDHIGGNASLQHRNPRIQTYAHPIALPVIQDPARSQPLHLYRKTIWGRPEPSQAHPLKDGSTIKTDHFKFKVIYTPGHTQDHLCLYEPDQQWIFTGDLFVGGKDRAIRAGSDIWQIIDSLKMIAALPLKGMFPSSARVRQMPQRDLLAKIDYLESKGKQVCELFNQGWTINKISREVFGKLLWIEVITLGHLSRRNLVISYLNHPPD